MLNEGDLVLLLTEDNKKYLMEYKVGLKFSFHLGSIEFIENLKYGDILITSKGYKVFVLEPSNGEIMINVKRKTNIIYPREAGYIITHTNIKSGSRVIETGTGSGAMTILLSKIVGKEGKVYTFERREEHLKRAIENVKRAKAEHNVEFFLLDPSIEGYPVNNIDCAIIDVPEPWTLVKAVYNALKNSGFWVSISPTIEQVIQTVEELKNYNFLDIKTVELLEREILVRKGKTRPKETMIAHIGYLTIARKLV
ncbi:MAG: tRNA (adenine-N1)-methyltransferase [candidate division WOR-3 bacterium]